MPEDLEHWLFLFSQEHVRHTCSFVSTVTIKAADVKIALSKCWAVRGTWSCVSPPQMAGKLRRKKLLGLGPRVMCRGGRHRWRTGLWKRGCTACFQAEGKDWRECEVVRNSSYFKVTRAEGGWEAMAAKGWGLERAVPSFGKELWCDSRNWILFCSQG